MIVPLRKHRHVSMEGTKILVEQTVFVVAAKLREAVRDDGFFLSHDVAPHLAVRQLQLTLDRAIGIDVIAAMDEEVRAVVQHGAVGAISPARGIDAPALPCGIAGPEKRNVAPLGRRGAEAPDLHFTGMAGVKALEANAIENLLSRRQA